MQFLESAHRFELHKDSVLHDEIQSIAPHRFSTEAEGYLTLGVVGHPASAKCHPEGATVGVLEEPGAEGSVDVHGGTQHQRGDRLE